MAWSLAPAHARAAGEVGRRSAATTEATARNPFTPPRAWENEPLQMRLLVPGGWEQSSSPAYPGQIVLFRRWPRGESVSWADLWLGREPLDGAGLDELVARNRRALESLGFKVTAQASVNTPLGPAVQLELAAPRDRRRFRQHYFIHGDYGVVLSLGILPARYEELRGTLEQVLRTLVFTDEGAPR